MNKLILAAALLAVPTLAAAQSQLGNGMGTQASATTQSSVPNDSSNADKTPTGMSGGSAHRTTHHRTTHGHKMSGDATSATSPR